jgi:hypothetical protein
MGRIRKPKQVKSKVKSIIIIIFFDISGIVHRKIRHGRPISRLRILLRRFTTTARKCAKTSPGTLATKNVPSHTSFFTRDFIIQNNMTVVPHPTYFSLFPTIEDKTGTPPFWLNWGNRSRIAGCHRTRLPGCVLKMAEVLRTVHIICEQILICLVLNIISKCSGCVISVDNLDDLQRAVDYCWSGWFLFNFN